MKQWIDGLIARTDAGTEALTRRAAQRYSRRGFVGRAALFMAGSTLLPVLPFDQGGRAFAADGNAPEKQDDDPLSCDYWRYCAIDGNLCNDCGGTLTSCPPGADASKVSWVGTCKNPTDGKDYVVSYNDCCGKATCTGTECINSERERPGYQMSLHNDINWCMANKSMGYHCTVAVLVGQVDESSPA